ncbi:Global transcription regulator sge1 [Cyphellophora attinorum]|uniref:Global transcription regulator sge1 n=1 Tax=Cyphellophora attinorum TaxID=1664694 RepID=A0A0N1HGD0_9EURO|nr:Global transcription regulator sge1 [Phialophora attinorum]KPI44653.1 Global transcription regulator sge1 [Phialophora attinorum]
MSTGGAALQPTFQGHVATTQDALILFEACLQGHLSHVPRRPHDRERNSLIRSGSVFIYEENASGIKRWTDGVTWSPSRILGNFLVYRELDKPFPPGEKKRAMKKQNRRPSRPGEPYPGAMGGGSENGSFGAERTPTETERQLIGSLIDSYGFKADGLVKKTMSVTVQGVTHHLVSYYNVNEVVAGQLRTPGQTDNLQYIRPRPELTSKQSFRSPLEDNEDVDGIRDGSNAYRYGVTPHHQPYVQDYRQAHYGMNSRSAHVIRLPANTGRDTSDADSARPEYASYDQSSYNRGYDSKAPISSSMPSMMSDRNSSIMYPPPSSMQRPMNNLSPVGMDQSRSMSYRPSYGMGSTASPIDGHRPSDDRRDSGAPNSQMYGSRPPYPYEASQQQMHQPPYPQNPNGSGSWSTNSHPQQS